MIDPTNFLIGTTPRGDPVATCGQGRLAVGGSEREL